MSSIEWGIQGFDELVDDEEYGGIPKNTNTLIYGPPKTGKSIFCNQFTYKGLLNEEPCLYITTDIGIKQLKNDMMDFQWFIQNYIDEQMFYVIDGVSKLSDVKLEDTGTFKMSTINNPTDIMVKVGVGTGFVYKKTDHFRSVLDSLTTLFAFNPEQTVLRLLKAYLRRVNEAGGSSIVAYTEGTTDPNIENMLKSLFDHRIRLDGINIRVETISEDFDEIVEVESGYDISDKGITVMIKQ